MAKYRCLGPCHKNVLATATNRYRKHDVTKGNECENSGEFVPAFLIKRGPETEDSDAPVFGRDYAQCPECDAKPALEADARITRHGPSKDACPASGRIYEGGEEECQESPSQSPELTTTPEPSAKQQSDGPSDAHAARPASDGTPESAASTNPRQTPCGHDITVMCEECKETAAQTLKAAQQSRLTARTPDSTTDAAPTSAPSPFAQPGNPFAKPAALPKGVTAVQPMTDKGREIAARLKETFYAYSNRMERNVQTTLGPSEIGSPCDRRIALSLLQVPAVNPGGDNWASFVGTCVHTGLAEMFMWADAGTGRYAVEVPLTFPSVHVPKGTTDLLDRVLLMADDHKLMGRWSLDKLRTKGPTPTYRVQLHTYAYGLRLKGEKVEHVALIGWPRTGSNLDDLYVWTEPYDPAVARDAIARVDDIAGRVKYMTENAMTLPLDAARNFPVADDCRFCPFHAPGDSKGERGCNGKP